MCPEVYVGPENAKTKRVLDRVLERYGIDRVNYHVDGRGRVWLNLDSTVEYPGGPFHQGKIVEIIYP